MASSQSKRLDTDSITRSLNQLAEQYHIKTWVLAYSGGLDSQVLLHLLHQHDQPLRAIYIDHGLQAESVRWAQHCAEQCRQRGIPFQSISVKAHPEKGESPEAAARAARYAALAKHITEGVCLVTAQHLDDQSETVLLQLLRGAGAAGLAAMPVINAFAGGWHCRPLLATSREAIQHYADEQQLQWVEDPSNQLQHYDRNYLRHSVLPEMRQRWPAVDKTLGQFAEQQAENSRLLDTLAELDSVGRLLGDNSLDIEQLRELDEARLRNLLRFWLRVQHYPMPSRAVLQQIVSQMTGHTHDTHLCVSWADVEVRRFRDRLYTLKQTTHDARQVFDWHGKGVLQLDSIGQQLFLETTQSSDAIPYVIDTERLGQSLRVGFRQGGERIQPAGRQGHRDLKSLFQEAGIPSWQRDRIPLLYAGDQLVAVVGYWVAQEWAVKGQGVWPCLLPMDENKPAGY